VAFGKLRAALYTLAAAVAKRSEPWSWHPARHAL